MGGGSAASPVGVRRERNPLLSLAGSREPLLWCGRVKKKQKKNKNSCRVTRGPAWNELIDRRRGHALAMAIATKTNQVVGARRPR